MKYRLLLMRTHRHREEDSTRSDAERPATQRMMKIQNKVPIYDAAQNEKKNLFYRSWEILNEVNFSD
jgi:hypothetical protein